ncbi:MAG TPA: ferritin-like domain-containing protein [Thermoleophilaceae bacterium]|nr:ferritin-like domain-containing protein [Thermoleophilaceae bacterium]
MNLDIRVPGTTRRELMLRGALGVASVSGVAAVGPFVSQALGQSGRIDVEIVQFALLLEQLEAEYYRRALREVPDLSPPVRRLAREIYDNESLHVETLNQLAVQLGSQPGEPPQFEFGDAVRSEQAFLGLAQTLEDTGVSAYNGAAPMVEQDDVLDAAGQIVQVEARHAALIRFERGEDITPGAFDKALSMSQVRALAKPYISQ